MRTSSPDPGLTIHHFREPFLASIRLHSHLYYLAGNRIRPAISVVLYGFFMFPFFFLNSCQNPQTGVAVRKEIQLENPRYFRPLSNIESLYRKVKQRFGVNVLPNSFSRIAGFWNAGRIDAHHSHRCRRWHMPSPLSLSYFRPSNIQEPSAEPCRRAFLTSSPPNPPLSKKQLKPSRSNSANAPTPSDPFAKRCTSALHAEINEGYVLRVL